MKSDINVIYLGGPTVILEIGGLRLMTDPTFDPIGETCMVGDKPGYWKTAAPAITEIGHIDAVLLSHDQHKDNLYNLGREFLQQVSRTQTTLDGAERLGGKAMGLAPFQQIKLNTEVTITGTPARHGPAGTLHITGEVTGFLVETKGMQVYFTGDSVYYEGIKAVADKFKPAYVFIFAGAAHTIATVSEMHAYLSLPKPRHSLVSFHRFEQISVQNSENYELYSTQFYSIAVKKNFKGKIRYGQSFYDFDEGMMSFIGPGQLLGPAAGTVVPTQGYCLLFHPEFLKGYTLGSDIREFNYFSYELNEALHLSEQEEKLIESLMLQIECEYKSSIDNLSQDVMITYITLLLQYCQRFYNRQFITRKPANSDMLVKLDRLLDDYIENGIATNKGLPNVKYLADQINVSPNYSSDMLRAVTGLSTQSHIQNKLIEKTKVLLTTTELTISEVAYKLGFERPQSLSNFFKSKTNLSPFAYRNSIN